SKVYANSGEYIRQMAYGPLTGLFYCTSEGVNRIGAKGSVPLISTPDAQISLQKGTLYVLLSKSLGVLALDGVKDLKRFDKAFKEVPVTQLPDARITGVRFFEAGKDLPESGDRKYATQFDHQTTRFVYCQADLENLQYNKRGHRETVTMELYRAGRDEPLQSESMSFDCRKDYASMWGWAKFGSDDVGTLYPRPYTVKVYLNGKLVNESKFTVTGEPSLLEAAGYHDAAAVNKLIKSGADVNMTGNDGTTPLMFAALVSDAEIVKLLLASGAKVNARRADGQTALLMDGETWSDDPTIAGLLLNAGAEIDARDNEGKTALHKATNKGKEKVIKLLLDRGAGVGVKDNKGVTPLLAGNWRFGTDDKAVVRTTEMLLSRGADPEAKDTYGNTALFSAVEGRNIDIVSALIKRGADVNAAGKIYGTTERSVLGFVLDQYRVFRPYRNDRVRLVEIARLLQEKGADLNTSEFAQAYFRGVDEVLDARHMARLIEMSELAASDCQPDDPSLRKADIRGLLNAACREILDAKDEYAYYSALNLCEEAGNRARKWGLSSSCPEISFNMGLIYMQVGSSSNATKYFREYLAMSPTGSCAARARELINQMD
ncbi:MAG TPA: ankyrin repeat domain-containing protein, partial [Armatimonadota bacterium]